jgi:mRNA (guanine-N7-)-methyltransferase
LNLAVAKPDVDIIASAFTGEVTAMRDAVRDAYNRRSMPNCGRGVGRGRGGGGRRGGGRGRGRGQNASPAAVAADSTWAVREFLNLMKRLLYERYLRPGQSIADFCCGRGGDLSKAAHQRAMSYIGVDFAPNELEEARFRAKTTPIVQRNITETQFVEHDLRYNVLQIGPTVEVVSCQLALHYLWGDANHVDTFLTSVRDSLKIGGFFILTLVDADKIPSKGILDHPYIKLTPPTPKLQENKLPTNRLQYRFTFPGLVRDVEEYVVPREDLLQRCAAFSLQLVETFSVREMLPRLMSMHPTKPPLTDHDWTVLDLYRSYAFQRK